jgi:hypothetical protein
MLWLLVSRKSRLLYKNNAIRYLLDLEKVSVFNKTSFKVFAEVLSPKHWSLVSVPVYHLPIMRAGFWGKGNKVCYSSDEAEDRESQPLKALSSHFWEKWENGQLWIEGSGAQLECVSRWPLALILQTSGTTSLKLYILAGRFTARVVSKRSEGETCLV